MHYEGVVAMLLFSAAFLLYGGYNIHIGLLCRKEENLHWALGKRVSTKTVRNVYEPGTWKRKKLPHYTHFTYEYTVEGKTYTLQGSLGVAPGKLPNAPRVIYLKKHPKVSKIEGIWDFHALPMGLFLTFGGLFFGIIAVLSLFI